MVRQHPQWIAAREQVRGGVIGEPRFMQVGFGYFNDDPSNIRNMADIGGARSTTSAATPSSRRAGSSRPRQRRVAATMDLDPAFGTDRSTSGLLDFGAGRQLAFAISTQAAPYQRVVLEGTRGRLEIEIPFNAPAGPALPLLDRRRQRPRGDDVAGGRSVSASGRGLLARRSPRAARRAALDDAVWNMRTIDALFASARSGRFEQP